MSTIAQFCWLSELQLTVVQKMPENKPCSLVHVNSIDKCTTKTNLKSTK